MSSISVVVNTKNAAETLDRALASVAWADEIVVVDMHSTDDTAKIAKKYTKKIFNHKDVGYVEPARNFAINKASGDWILVLDADEEVSSSLAEKLQQLVSGDATAQAYYLPRKNILFGQWYRYGGYWPDHNIRFFKKGSVTWSNAIHAVPTLTGKVDYLAASEKLAIIHHHYTTIDQFVERLTRYTTHEVSSRGDSLITSESVISSFGDELLSRLFQHRGVDGGIHGVGQAMLQASYELVVALKIWEKQGFSVRNKEQALTFKALRSFQRGLDYWIADWHVAHTSGLQQLWWRLRRKLMR